MKQIPQEGIEKSYKRHKLILINIYIEEFWKQKAGMKWFKDGERNTKFFHSVVKGRRSRLKVSRIQNEEGEWMENQNDIAEAAVEFYKDQFTRQDHDIDWDILNDLPKLINEDASVLMHSIPSKEEVHQAVMGLNRTSAGGPDGMTRAFYQDTWDIIGDDVYEMVKAFFNGADLPRYVTHTNLVLIPKKPVVTTFSDLRPISLSSFVNKIFSRIVHERIKSVLPVIISKEQAGFVQGRSIVENVLLVKEGQVSKLGHKIGYDESI